MSQSTHRPLAEPVSTGVSWLRGAVSVSVLLHVVMALAWWAFHERAAKREVSVVDIEMAPAPPKAEALPEEVAKPPEAAPKTEQSAESEPDEPAKPDDEDLLAVHDAGIDAPPDAAPADAAVDAQKKKPKPDAAEPMSTDLADGGLDAGFDAGVDAGVDDGGTDDAMPTLAVNPLEGGDAGDPRVGLLDAGLELGGDAGAQVAATDPGLGSGGGSGLGTGSGEGSGVAGAIETGSGSGVAGTTNQPGVDGAPTTAGTASNLLAYFPPGHQVTALIRFDRLRGTEWAEPAERLFKPMPDYQLLFGGSTASVATKFDTLVISSPRPRDVNATTLVVRTAMTRPQLRDYLKNPATPIAWSVAKGGMLGKRSGKLFQGDKRVILSPWKHWMVLADPADLPGLMTAAKGNIDTVETKAVLPPWLQSIRDIEKESGDDKQKGPALVLTLAGPGTRYDIPDVGLGVTSLPSPERISLAMELVKQGWLIRGNIVFAKEADAIEFAQAVADMQQKIVDSRIFSMLLRRQHALNVVTGLSVARTGARVSYATSMSISDARALMTAAAATLDSYFAGQ